MTLPSAKEIARAWRQVEVAYKKWLLLKTGRETKGVRENELLVKLQARAALVRRKAVMAKVAKIRMRANPVTPHIRVPELRGVLAARPAPGT